MISVIIVNYNTKNLLKLCLHSIQVDTPELDYELIVIDNDSKDDSVKMLEKDFPEVKLIKNTINAGFAKAVNQGLKIAQGDYILLANSDIIVHNGALRKMQKVVVNNKVDILGACMIYPNGKLQATVGRFPSRSTEFFTKTRLYKIFNYGRYFKPKFKKLTYIDWVSAGFMMIKKPVVEKLKGFDENFFMYLEDIDFCKRATQAGFKVAVSPDIDVIHKHQGSADKGVFDVNDYELESLKYYFDKWKI